MNHPFDARTFVARRWLVFSFLVILVLIPIAYAPILDKQFLQEDFVQVGIRHFDAQAAAQSDAWDAWLPLAWKWGFLAPVTKRAVIRVVRDWTLWTDYFAWGLQPLGYHLTNLLLHALISFCVTLLMWRLMRERVAAALAGILFAVMSIHPEAVADIPSRGHELVALCMVLTLIFYTRLPSRRALFYGAITLGLGLLSVETAMTTPLLLLAYDLIYQRAEGWRALVKRELPFWLIVLAYVGLRIALFGGGGGTPALDAMATWNFFWSGYTQYASDPFSGDIALWQTVGVTALFLFLLLVYRKRRAVVFGFVWMPIPLLVAFAFPPQERYFYVPSVGLALALAGILADPLPRLKFSHGKFYHGKISRALGAALAVLLILVYTVSLYRLNENWRNASQLAQDILAQVRALHPTLPENSTLVFVGLPARARRAPVFSDPLNIQYAIALTYDDPSLQATTMDAFPPFAEHPERTFFFEYDARKISERVDLETQLRQNLTCANGVSEIVWNFDTDAQGWTIWNDVANAEVEDGEWRLDVQGADPNLGSPLVNLRGQRLGEIQLTMRVRAARSPLQGAWYWQTRGMENFSPALVQDFDVLADGAMHTYAVALPVQRGDVIAQLRLDPTDAPAQLAIDSITLICK
ncbi:MAG: hypothetical protein HY741_02495 [Chloroflexi bacterium]|nr:hypothetical protein [Chloroflexota bacterium]